MLPPGAVLSGPPVSDGVAFFAAPRAVGPPLVQESLALAADAVIASETMQLLPLHNRLAGPLAVGRPFNARHPAGTDVPRLVKDGRIVNCIRQRGIFTPPEDEHGEIYPGLCLEDRDHDDRYETAILWPYHIDRARERVVAVAPVRLEPNPVASAEDRDALRVKRRIRVTHVGADEAQIIAEQGIATSRQADVTSYVGRPEDSLTLPLREGAGGNLGGIEIRLRRDGAGWRIAASGRMAPWLELRDNSMLIVAGGLDYPRRP